MKANHPGALDVLVVLCAGVSLQDVAVEDVEVHAVPPLVAALHQHSQAMEHFRCLGVRAENELCW
eukprot:11202786-Lingulodinium_polyedra.AAC.1